MISRMAMDDIEELRAKGVEVSDRDVVRLNALGLRVERPAHADALDALPRVAFLGDVAIREPSIGAEIWCADVQKWFDFDDSRTAVAVRAFACSRDPAELPDPYDMKRVRKAVRGFLKAVAPFTRRQLMLALDYAMNGRDGDEPDWEPRKDGTEDEIQEDRDEVRSVAAGLLADAQAVPLGVPAADLRAMTYGRLREIVRRAVALKLGGGEAKHDALAVGDYMRARDEIRDRKSGAEVDDDDKKAEAGEDDSDDS